MNNTIHFSCINCDENLEANFGEKTISKEQSTWIKCNKCDTINLLSLKIEKPPLIVATPQNLDKRPIEAKTYPKDNGTAVVVCHDPGIK